ncbi:cupredoxin domain-containing protein [Pseudomonas petrae]|uniref:Plastocyanin/azurin family copper-binding protein n=1 Tax=Pseudomonas petrae TaxID=2912190 RepID=A0ABS9IA06_9PSED|nr:cupredoxin family protein [Pseudomonas petrae]MCF7535307.1 plastocyanin/azurin family copper-binding protein [Pseudomonas petrae]MCF7539036.1 plastocyanin/azurin family copper-binding protein [Pseudomonas petrae]MCF7544567.1 plastocyanin/azurin family copper-binding protein [Pseudomonas petrae]MCF7556920.1 plastocyanin/azurin family copper-binding protein [Pseudomonas petrae]
MLPRHFAIALLLGASLSAQASPGEHFAFGHPADAAQATRTVEVTLGDIYFEPKSLDLKKGETVRFMLVNKGRLLHEFNLGDAAMHAAHQQEMLKMTASGMLTPTGMKHDMAGMDHGMAHGGEQGPEQGAAGMKHDDPNSVLVEPGKTAELTWTFTDATGLEFACNIPGHYQAGMVGKVAIIQ